jgi:hypothetical protein
MFFAHLLSLFVIMVTSLPYPFSRPLWLVKSKFSWREQNPYKTQPVWHNVIQLLSATRNRPLKQTGWGEMGVNTETGSMLPLNDKDTFASTFQGQKSLCSSDPQFFREHRYIRRTTWSPFLWRSG